MGSEMCIRDSCHVVRRRREIKRRAVALKGEKCVVCGYDRCIQALTFHHLDSEAKELAIARYSVSWARIEAELKKCVLLCNRCHTEVHAGLIIMPSGLTGKALRC